MTTTDEFNIDAVEMKNSIQANLQAERERLGDAECDRRREEWLATSQDMLAVLWHQQSAHGRKG